MPLGRESPGELKANGGSGCGRGQEEEEGGRKEDRWSDKSK
jgi:hypothetical protein